MAQSRQAVDPNEKTGKAALARGWTDIAMLARERIRRVLALDSVAPTEGFRAFRLEASTVRRWTGSPEATAEAYLEQLEAFAASPLADADPQAIIWEVALREGYPLTSVIDAVEGAESLWRVRDPDTARAFAICLAATIDPAAIDALELAKDELLVVRESALTDSLAANLALQCTLKVL